MLLNNSVDKWVEPPVPPEASPEVSPPAIRRISPASFLLALAAATLGAGIAALWLTESNALVQTPYHHDDFEQISLQIEGDYVHHMRTTWTPDSTLWRDDQHQACASPAMVVIPPPLVHTSQGVGDMPHWLIDLFAPPRVDFSDKPGWVLNADEYPMPALRA